MATQLFFTFTTSDYSTGNNDTNLRSTASGWTAKALSLSRGAAVQNPTTTSVAGPIGGLEIGTIPLVWYTAPLDADITVSGSITWNLWGAESAMAANAAINGQIEVVDGATGTITLIDKTARTIELGTSSSVHNFAETPGAGVACKRGDRLRVRVFYDDSIDGNMAAASTLTFSYGSTTGAVSGDSYVTLTENLTFVSEPAGSQVFLTDTASAVSTASVDREAWTSRGAGVQTDVRNTAAGFTAPLQMTDTAGGTVVDWFTKPLAAFTLGGAVRANIRAAESNGAANAAARVEIARVAGDGTSPTAWASATSFAEFNTTEGAISFLLAGDDLAISDGQRLLIRVLIDDVTDSAAGGMAASHTVTLYYAGTSGGASGDTYLTFTQTLTEAAGGNQTVTPTTAALVITKNIPTVTASDNQSVTPTPASLTATAFAPTVPLGEIITVPTAGGAGYAATVTADSPIAYLRFGEPSGTVANDEIMAAEAEYINTPTLGVTGLLTNDADTAVTFSRASTEYAYHENEMPAGSSVGVSAEVWLRFATLTAATLYPVYRWWVPTPVSESRVHYNVNDGQLKYQYYDGTTREISSSAWSPSTATTYHIVVTHDYVLDSVKFYVNGTLHSTVDVSAFGTPVPHIAASWCTIARGGADYFDGTLDEFALYNSVLSGTRVSAHYSAGTSTGGLVLTTYIPTVTVAVATIVTPTTASLALATFAPTVTAPDPQLVTPTTKSAVLATFAPTVTASDHQAVTPTTTALALAAFAPVVTATDVQLVTPTTAAIVLSAFAPTVSATDHQLVSPTTKALTLSTFTPSVTAGDQQLVTPTTKALALSTFAPVVSTPETVTPTTTALILATFAATVTATDHQLVIPTTKTAVLTTFAPTVTAPDHQLVTPSNAAVTLATFAPTVTSAQHQVATPITATLTTASFAPAISVSDHQAITPTTKALTLTADAPVVTTPILAIPTTTALVLTKNAPTVTTPQTFTPTTKVLTLSTFAPTVTNPQTYVPDTAVLVTTKYAPIVDVTAASTIVVPNATLTITENVAEVSATAHLAVTPPAATLTLAQFAPTVTATAHEVVTPTVKSLIATTFAPTISTSDQQAVVPTTKALTLSTFVPTVSFTAHVAVIPSTKVLQLTAFAPTARVANYAIPTTAGLTISAFAPFVESTQNAYIEIVPNALTITEYPPTLSITGHADLVPITTALLLTTYAPTAETHSITPLPHPIYGFAIVAMGDSAGVGVENGGATVRSEGGGTAVLTSGPSARVTIR